MPLAPHVASDLGSSRQAQTGRSHRHADPRSSRLPGIL